LLQLLTNHADVIASFGIISEAGVEDYAVSETLNRTFSRTSEAVGEVSDAFEACILGMFPNEGFLCEEISGRESIILQTAKQARVAISTSASALAWQGSRCGFAIVILPTID